MSLAGNLYIEDGKELFNDGSLAIVWVKLDKDSAIFSGHFPGKPVVPGVALIDMCKSVLESLEDSSFEISSIRSAKFLSVLSPDKEERLQIKIEWKESPSENSRKCMITISGQDTVYSKISLIYNLI